MTALYLALIYGAAALILYTYLGYPLLLAVIAALKGPRSEPPEQGEWPRITILLPAYNEEAVIARTLENLLQLDYPADRRRIIVLSDASTDRTDAIVGQFASRGVTLVRLPRRGGKTAAENVALPVLDTEIVVNTDASVHVERRALKALIACFADPTVGVASSHNVSVARIDEFANYAESWYVGYDMWIRGLETAVFGIVGAAGCLYAARVRTQAQVLPGHVSRDFASSLLAREQKLRAVSVREAICFVPRIGSLRQEYWRKVRTITRGIDTLVLKKALLNPLRYGTFAWILASHKVCRWIVPHATLLGFLALTVVARTVPLARWGVLAALVACACALVGWSWPDSKRLPKFIAVPAYLVIGNLAALHASLRAGRHRTPLWEPTRRDTVLIATPPGGVLDG